MIGSYGFVYIIENLLNGKCYVGQTTNPTKRWSKHCSEESHSRAIYSAIQKYGRENFDFVLLESCNSLQELNTREKFWVECLGTLSPHGYNLIEGGGSSGKCSMETRLRISKSKRGRKWSDKEWRKRTLNNYFSNKTHCPRGHSYDEENTYIRSNGHRMCRACHRNRERARLQKRKKEG